MTSTPNNIASEEWEKEFDEKFNDNFVYWQELAAEIRIGDPDFKSLKAFISKTRQEAIAGERDRIARALHEILLHSDFENDPHGLFNKIKSLQDSLLTPSPDTSKLSQCNDCFDGDHEKCSKGQCGCTH